MSHIQFQGDEEGAANGADSPMRDEPFKNESNISKPTKRMRWATQRHKGDSALKKRMSIGKRFSRHLATGDDKRPGSKKGVLDEADPLEVKFQPRTIYMNLPIPDSVRDEKGNLVQEYQRNKIRTAKYTALSFVPKNLWFQFHNIANIYFLFIIILSVSCI